MGNTRSTLEPNAIVRGRAKPGTQVRVVATVLACAIGLMLAARFAAGDDPAAPTSHAVRADPTDGFSVGEEVPTSFGFVAVEYARAIAGPTMDQIAGGHNAAGLVPEGAIEVQVGTTMTNFTKAALSYRPDQFELLDGAGNTIPLSEAPEVPGQLQPSAAIDMTLKFVTTTDARPFSVRFVDSTTSEVRMIPLGAVGCAVSSGAGEELPSADGCSQPSTGGDHATHGVPSGGN